MRKDNKIKLGLYYISDTLNYQHISKSFVNIPKYVAVECENISCEVNYFSEKCYDDETLNRIVSLPILNIKIKVIRFFLSLFSLIKKRYDIQMILHINVFSYIFSEIYKLVRPDGKIYLKLDISVDFFNKNLSYFKRLYIKRLLKKSDVISYESKLVYDLIKTSDIFSSVLDKLIYLPNCTAESTTFAPEFEKKKIMITVGRLGTYQKNTELLLDVLDNIDLKDWEFHFIGSSTDDIKRRINNCSNKNVKFIGEISKRSEMIKKYKKSSIFVLSSRYEGFATVLVEASRYANYIVSTDVNGARDVTNNFKFGIEFSTKEELNEIICNIVSSKSQEFMDDAINNSYYVQNIFNWTYQVHHSELIKRLQ